MTTTDGNGIVFLEEDDNISPFHTLINGLQQATSNVVTGLKTLPVTSDQIPTTIHKDALYLRGELPRFYLRDDSDTYQGAQIQSLEGGATRGILRFTSTGAIWMYAGGANNSTAGILAINPNGTITMSPAGSSVNRPIPFAVASGRTNITIPSSSIAQVSVTFPTGRFTQQPNGFASIRATNPDIYKARFVASGTTGGTAYATNASTASITLGLEWLAIQMTPSNVAG